MFYLSADEGGAEDKLFSTAVVNIIVTDVNDNAPRFLYAPYEFELDSLNATTIGRVTAIDDDLGPGGIVKFRLVEQREVRSFEIFKGILGLPRLSEISGVTLTLIFPTLLRCHSDVKIIDFSGEFKEMSL